MATSTNKKHYYACKWQAKPQNKKEDIEAYLNLLDNSKDLQEPPTDK